MPDQQNASWHILMVDDDDDEYILVRSMLDDLQGRTIRLDWVQGYDAAQKLLESNTYDAVLVDYDLGAKTGLELIRETAQAGYPAPLILYTGRGNYGVDLEAMQAGATLYLAKKEATPLLMERLLRYAIEHKRSQ